MAGGRLGRLITGSVLAVAPRAAFLVRRAFVVPSLPASDTDHVSILSALSTAGVARASTATVSTPDGNVPNVPARLPRRPAHNASATALGANRTTRLACKSVAMRSASRRLCPVADSG